jgi:hypothetical protein
MSILISPSVRGPAALLIAALAGASCTEPRRIDPGTPSPASPLVLRAELSDSGATAGSLVAITLRLAGPSIATATVRLAYDSTGLTYASEDTIPDGATRVVNPAAGLVRIAAVAPRGFVDGRLHVLRFIVRRTSALQSLRPAVDEAHTVTGADAATTVRRP